MTVLADLLAAQARGETSAVSLLDHAMQRIREADDGRIHTAVFEATARAEARAVDILREGGVPAAPLAGLPVALKVLFDVAGQVTHAGSRLLADAAPAAVDAPVVSRLRRAGAVLTGHTNMTEFAYSGLGLNPHYGTPANPLDPTRIPGGSSSGAAVAVAQGMAAAAVGSDTGGSIRIPAAFCGLVGFKPSQARVPLDGAFPLSSSLDSIGPIASSVACCALLDAILAGEAPWTPETLPAAGLRLAIPQRYVLDDMDHTVAAAFQRAVSRLSAAGVPVQDVAADNLGELPALLAGGGFTAAESYRVHRHWLEHDADQYDPRVRVRIERGASISAADYLALQQERSRQIALMDRLLEDHDALLLPTVPIIPPRFDELEDDADYGRINLLALRNPTVGNLLDLCGVSLPCHAPGEQPVGLMLLARNGADRRLLRVAATVEALLGARSPT